MHIAAFSPTYLRREDVPEDVVANERRIAEETARNEGKPEQALPKIIEGRLNGFYKENVLLDQGFAKDPKQSVGKIVEEAGGTITGFVRFRGGSGLLRVAQGCPGPRQRGPRLTGPHP